MTIFTMLVGVIASGKSSEANNIASQTNATVISSDAYRKLLYGDENIQGDNNVLFEKIHNEIIEKLKLGIDVILDSTSLNYKNRMTLLQKLNKLDVQKNCVLMATDIETCKERNKNRDRVVPEYVLDRMRKQFTCPQFFEGFDKIEILFDYNREKYSLINLYRLMDNFGQDNSHHSLTLGEHCRKVSKFIYNQTEDHGLAMAGVLHDVGKVYTKSFKNSKEEITEEAHYYNHESISAYESLFYLDRYGFNTNEILQTCGLIQLHMRPYNLQTDKAKEKLLKLVGKEMYNQLIILNEVDKLAH